MEQQKLLNKQQHGNDHPHSVVGTVVTTPDNGPVAGLVDTSTSGRRDGGHPNSAFLPPMNDFRHQSELPPDMWHSGFCDCCQDMNSCCEVLWCGNCVFAQQYHKIKTGMIGVDWPMCLGVFCADLLLKGGAIAFLTWDLRNQIRKRWNIEPQANDITECCKSFCCPGLAMCQIHRELTVRGYWPGSLFCKDPNPVLIRPMQ